MPDTDDNPQSQPPSPKGAPGSLGDLVKAESMVQLAIALPMGCLLGWFVGARLDKQFHTEWIQILGLILGAIGGFWQIISTAQKYMKRG